jgi:ribonuclease HII
MLQDPDAFIGRVARVKAQERHRSGALRMPALIALHELGVQVGEAVVVLDGSHNWLTPALSSPLRVITRTKADRDCAVVAGASVVAKVERDAVMVALSEDLPGYGWEGNKGYGSAGHFEAIGSLGATDFHRRTWLHAKSPG